MGGGVGVGTGDKNFRRDRGAMNSRGVATLQDGMA